MPISKQNTNFSKNIQTTQPYPTNLSSNENKNTEQNTLTQTTKNPNTSDTPAPKKRTKISTEESPVTLENIIESIILTPSPDVNMNSSSQ